MKIGITGNYGNKNQGDEAILEGIIVQLEQAYSIERGDIRVFTNDPEETRDKLGVEARPLFKKTRTDPGSLLKTIRETKPYIRDLDMLIIGGGGILMDLYMSSIAIFTSYAWLARRFGVPYAVFGVGAGPIKTRIGKYLVRYTARHAEIVTVRDKQSKQLLKSIGVEQPAHVIVDPAFHVPVPASAADQSANLKIGVTALPYFHHSYWPENDDEKYTHYIEGMAANLDQLLDEAPDAEITFFATKYPHDLGAASDIQSLMQKQNRTSMQEELLTHQELMMLINEQNLIIGTRLHSLILALAAEKPIMAASYHGKVTAFMDMIGRPDASISVEEVGKKPRFFAEIYRDMASDWMATQEAFRDISDRMKSRQPDGMTLIQNTIPAPDQKRKQA